MPSSGATSPLRSLGSAFQHLHHSVAQISLHLESGACASLILSTSSIHPVLAATAQARPVSSRPPAPNNTSTSCSSSSAPQSPAPTPPQAVSRPLSSPSLASAAAAAPAVAPVAATTAAAVGRSNSSGLWDAARPLCFRGLLLPDSGSRRSSEDASSELRRGKATGSSPSVAAAVKATRVQAGLVGMLFSVPLVMRKVQDTDTRLFSGVTVLTGMIQCRNIGFG